MSSNRALARRLTQAGLVTSEGAMTSMPRFFVLSLVLALGAPRAGAQLRPPRPPPPPPARETEDPAPKVERHFQPWPRARRGRMDFDKADVRDVAKFVSEITNKNIIVSEKVRGGKLTIFSPAAVTGGEAYKAFLAALDVNGLTVVTSGKFLKIVPQAEAKGLAGPVYSGTKRAPKGDQMVTAILRIRHGDAKEINAVVGQLRNQRAGVNLVYGPTNSIILIDLAENMDRLLEIV